jgi:hypothetical protein
MSDLCIAHIALELPLASEMRGPTSVKTGSRPLWLGLGAAAWVQVASGTSSTFELYSLVLKVSLGADQSPLALACDVGENLGLLLRVLCNRLHPVARAAPLNRRWRVPSRVWHRVAPRLWCCAHAAFLDAPAMRRGEELCVMPPRRRVSRAVVTPVSSMRRSQPLRWR